MRALVASDGASALAFWKTIPGMGLSEADEPGELARFWGRNPRLSFGAFDGSQLVGTALAGHDGRRGFLYHVAVDATHRGQGLSQMLVDACLLGLKASGISKVHLFVLADNAEGLTYWARRRARGWKRRDNLVVFSLELLEGPST